MKITRAIFLGLILAGCESVSDKQLPSQTANVIAVDGNITSEEKNHLIFLSFPYKIQNAVPLPVTGATVTLTAGADNYTLTEDVGNPGNYLTPVMRAVTGTIYTLAINYKDKTYTASDSPPAVENMSSLTFQRVDTLFQITPLSEGAQPDFIRYQIVWGDTPYCVAGKSCAGEMYFYDLKSSDVNEIFKPGKDDFNFPPGSIVVRTKYSVSPAYRSFLRSMLSETEWRGGVFDVQRADVETNLSNGAVGFFAVSTVISDTTRVN